MLNAQHLTQILQVEKNAKLMCTQYGVLMHLSQTPLMLVTTVSS